MASFFGFIRRNWNGFNPPEVEKSPEAIRFGLLGASNIAPMALIGPAKSHSEVVIVAVAARNEVKAQEYAKKFKIEKVHKSYEELLKDPTIDAVYVALPNSHHFEWAMRSLRAGKHVLLEKPFTSNATEARTLVDFHQSLSNTPNAPRPVLLEAFHYLFHPAWHSFKALLTPSHIESVESKMGLLAGVFGKDDLRFRTDLAGGSLMDMGTYTISTLRQVFGTEPNELISAEPRLPPKGWDQSCDEAFKAQWKFPNGATGSIEADLRMKYYGVPFMMELPGVKVVHKEVPVDDQQAGANQTHTQKTTVTMSNFVAPHIWHSINTTTEHWIKDSEGKVHKKWVETNHKKAYVWENPTSDGNALPGEDYWATYRYMLEEFVNKVKGRPGSGVWVGGEDSVKQMTVIDGAYAKSGLPSRFSTGFK